VPEPLGKPVVTTTYVDANLYHCMLTGKSVSGILHLFNKTPVDWFAKKQGTAETATYGSEFVAGRRVTDQVIGKGTSWHYSSINSGLQVQAQGYWAHQVPFRMCVFS
jgi:hypothetical protein